MLPEWQRKKKKKREREPEINVATLIKKKKSERVVMWGEFN